jgi:four helix bundle protein
MDNIAEGYERQTNKQFVYFLFVSKGSCGEVRSQAYRALDFKYITQQEFEDIYARALEISKILHGLIQRLQPSDKNQ